MINFCVAKPCVAVSGSVNFVTKFTMGKKKIMNYSYFSFKYTSVQSFRNNFCPLTRIGNWCIPAISSLHSPSLKQWYSPNESSALLHEKSSGLNNTETLYIYWSSLLLLIIRYRNRYRRRDKPNFVAHKQTLTKEFYKNSFTKVQWHVYIYSNTNSLCR